MQPVKQQFWSAVQQNVKPKCVQGPLISENFQGDEDNQYGRGDGRKEGDKH
jgi:hypothetical protein